MFWNSGIFATTREQVTGTTTKTHKLCNNFTVIYFETIYFQWGYPNWATDQDQVTCRNSTASINWDISSQHGMFIRFITTQHPLPAVFLAEKTEQVINMCDNNVSVRHVIWWNNTGVASSAVLWPGTNIVLILCHTYFTMKIVIVKLLRTSMSWIMIVFSNCDIYILTLCITWVAIAMSERNKNV